MNGTCTGDSNSTCEGGFRNNSGCANTADCQGAMDENAIMEIFHNPMGLFLSRSAAVSHFKQDLQQVFTTPGDPTSSLVKWTAGGAQNPSNPAHVNSWDQAQYCYDRVNGANPLTPNVEACISLADPSGPTGGMGSDGMGNLQIATAMSANQFLGYTPDKLASLMTVSVLGIFDDAVNNMLHDVHLNMETLSHLADPALLTSTVSCFDCHVSLEVEGSIKATGTVGKEGIINDDNTFEATVDQYIGGPNDGLDYVTCTTACHHDGSQDGTVTAEEQGTYVVARLTATNSRTDNRVITFDASESACVDDCTFSPFTFTGCGSIVDELGGNGNDVIVIRDDNATTPCTGSIDVASSYDGGATPVTVAVEITADDSIVPAALVNSIVVTPTNTSEASGSECVQTYSVNLAAVLDADIDYGANVYVYWGDRTRSVVTPVELNGTTHVYDANGTKNIRVRTKDSNWEITDETTSVALSDVACP